MGRRHAETLAALQKLISSVKSSGLQSTADERYSVLSSIGRLVCEHPELVGTAEQLEELEAQSQILNKRLQAAQLYILNLNTQLVLARQAATDYFDAPPSGAVDHYALEMQLRNALGLPVARCEGADTDCGWMGPPESLVRKHGATLCPNCSSSVMVPSQITLRRANNEIRLVKAGDGDYDCLKSCIEDLEELPAK